MLLNRQIKQEVEGLFYSNAVIVVDVVSETPYTTYPEEAAEIDTGGAMPVPDPIVEKFHHIELRRLRKQYAFATCSQVTLITMAIASHIVRIERHQAHNGPTAIWSIDIFGEPCIELEEVKQCIPVFGKRLQTLAQRSLSRRQFSVRVLHDEYHHPNCS